MSEYDEIKENEVDGTSGEEYLELDPKRSNNLTLAVLSLLAAVLSGAVFSFILIWDNIAVLIVSVVLAVLGIILAALSRARLGYFHRIGIAGLIVGIIMTVVNLFYIIAVLIIIAALISAF